MKKCNFLICGDQVWFPVATLQFNTKKEIFDFINTYNLYFDMLEIFEGEERIFLGTKENFLSFDLV
ncbi:MAG: hypothetical protein KatS3mg035_2288 [Bacteroidia bacterium]|nr:MAG: hypothetical protein KatS3mg035_2288 [Bacteroidia bacterium]